MAADKSNKPAKPVAQSHKAADNPAVHVKDGAFVQGPQPKEPASGTKSIVVQTPKDVEPYPDGTHEVAAPEDVYWSSARVEKYNQLSGDEKNAPAEERKL